MSFHKSLVIAVEGLDGSGKDTVIEFIKNHLEEQGRRVSVFADLYSTETGADIRKLFIQAEGSLGFSTELSLMCAARSENVAKNILPALKRGDIVLLNRFTASTYAYQCMAKTVTPDEVSAEGLCLIKDGFLKCASRAVQTRKYAFDKLNSIYSFNTIVNKWIYVDIDPETQQQRLSLRKKTDYLDKASIEFHQKVRDGFTEFFHTFAINNKTNYLYNSKCTLEELKKESELLIDRVIMAAENIRLTPYKSDVEI